MPPRIRLSLSNKVKLNVDVRGGLPRGRARRRAPGRLRRRSMRTMTNKVSRTNRVSVLVAVAVFAVLTTIAAYAANGAEPTVSFEQDVQPLFNNNCVFCHMTGAESGNVNLEPGISYEALVGVKSTQYDLERV